MYTTKIPLTPYPYDCLLVIGEDQEIFDLLNTHGLDKEQTEFFEGKTGFAKDNRTIILWLRNPSILCLIHEAIHVTTFLFDRVGVPINFHNDETLAYMVQYLVREVLKVYGQYFNLAIEPIENKSWIEQEKERYLEYCQQEEIRTGLLGSPTGITNDEMFKVESILEENKRLNEYVEIQQTTIKNLKEQHDIGHKNKYGLSHAELELSYESLKRKIAGLEERARGERNLTQAEHKFYVDNIRQGYEEQLKTLRGVCVSHLEQIDQFKVLHSDSIDKMQKYYLKEEEKKNEEIIKLKKELEICNQYRDTREEGLDKARGVHPSQANLSQFSEQTLAIYCNRWFETYKEFPSIDKIDIEALNHIQGYLTTHVYRDEMILMLSVTDERFLELRINNLSTVTTQTKKYFDKLRGIENREGGC